MSPLSRNAKVAVALLAVAAVALLVSGCAFFKPGSLTLSQPAGTGPVRVHFVLCQPNEKEGCGENTETVTIQYLIGIAVPPGSAPPQTFTAAPTHGGAPIPFTRNDAIGAEMAASSASMQKLIGEASPKEQEEAAKVKQLIGGAWPPKGLQGVGYLSPPVEEVKGQSPEWTVDTDFGLPPGQGGQPFAGPFSTGIAVGFRAIESGESAGGAVHCIKFVPEVKPQKGEAFCSGSVAESQFGTADLGIAAPTLPGQAFVGGSAELSYPLNYAGGPGVTSFTLSATSTAAGAKTTLSPGAFTPDAPNPSTHLSPSGTSNVTVSVPPSVKPGTYQVTLTAKTAQGGSISQVGTFNVVKAVIKFGKVKIDSAKGLATLPVKVPGAGKLTISGKGIKKATKNSSKANQLKIKIKPTGRAAAGLQSSGKVKVKAKATFKPTSGISVSKSKSIILKLR